MAKDIHFSKGQARSLEERPNAHSIGKKALLCGCRRVNRVGVRAVASTPLEAR